MKEASSMDIREANCEQGLISMNLSKDSEEWVEGADCGGKVC